MNTDASNLTTIVRDLQIRDAAQDLLSALKRLLVDDEMRRDRDRPEYQDALAVARAAIAKAERSTV